MAQSNNIINRWSFKQFFLSNGKKLKRAVCENAETKESFIMLAFGISKETAKYVGFSSNLGELSSQEINSMKEDLQIVELRVSPEVAAKRKAKGQQVETYKLCMQGEDTWEEVEITGW